MLFGIVRKSIGVFITKAILVRFSESHCSCLGYVVIKGKEVNYSPKSELIVAIVFGAVPIVILIVTNSTLVSKCDHLDTTLYILWKDRL